VNDDSTEAETPAPPPSPELIRYNGSPYPSPCCARQQLHSGLKRIAEEEGCTDGMDMQSTPVHASFPRYLDMERSGHWQNMHTHSDYFEGSNESLSILSKMDDSLVEDTSKLSLAPMTTSKEAMETCAFSGERQQMSDEDRKARSLLIEKMEQHEALSQQLRRFKKRISGVSGFCEQPLLSEITSDGLITLNDDQEDFSLDEDISASENEQTLNKDSSDIISNGLESTGKDFQPLIPDTQSEKSGSLHFSGMIADKHLTSPFVGSMVYHDMLSQSISLSDLGCCYGRQRTDQAFTSLPFQASKGGTTQNHKLDDVSFMAPARPSSPEFDIEVPEQKAFLPSNVSYSYIAGEYSLISEAEDSLEKSRDKDTIEAPDGNCAAVGNATVSADEDGGFLSILSAAALYHASLKHPSGDHFDSSSNVGLTENKDMCSQNVQEKLQCTSSPTVLLVHNECDDMEKKVIFHHLPEEACGEFGEKSQEHKESLCTDLRNADVVEDDHSLLSGIREGSVIGGSTHQNGGSCCREMDARNDLNDNDRRNIEDMKTQQSCSAEGFNDTLEEMEMLLKYGMDYMLSSNDKECPDMTDKQIVCYNMSTPNKPLCEVSEFKDFEEANNEGENHCHVTDDTETCSKNHSGGGFARPETSPSAVSHKNPEPFSCGVVCDYVKTAPVDETHDNLCVKPESVPFGKFHSKLQAVMSPTTNVKLCRIVRSDKAVPFKIPVKAVPHATSIPKLTALRGDRKCSFKPTTVVTPGKRPLNYKNIMSPVGAYIHNIPTPSLVTTVKPNLAHTGIPKRMLVDRDAAVMSRPAAMSRIEKVCLKVGVTFLLVAVIECVCVCVCVRVSE
jgi:hypothetical protein